MAFLLPLAVEAAPFFAEAIEAAPALFEAGASLFQGSETLPALFSSFEAFAEEPSVSGFMDFGKEAFKTGRQLYAGAKAAKRAWDEIEGEKNHNNKRQRTLGDGSWSAAMGGRSARIQAMNVFNTGTTSSGVIYDGIMANGINLSTGTNNYSVSALVNQTNTGPTQTAPSQAPAATSDAGAAFEASRSDNVSTTGNGVNISTTGVGNSAQQQQSVNSSSFQNSMQNNIGSNSPHQTHM
jgi:hypothetical protein